VTWRRALFLAAVLQACHATLEPSVPEPPNEPLSELEAERFGPGFDVAWLGSKQDVSYVHLGEEHVVWVDKNRNVLMGKSFDQLSPTGIQALGAVIGSEPGAVYSLTDDDEILLQRPGKRPKSLWKAPWEIDKLRSDENGFYALLINCRSCVTWHREQIWRIPKHQGRPRVLYSEFAEIINDIHAIDGSLYANVIRWRDTEFAKLRFSTRGRSHSPEFVNDIPIAIDDNFTYEFDIHGTYRVSKADDSRVKLRRFARRPDAVDADDFVYGGGEQVICVGEGRRPRSPNCQLGCCARTRHACHHQNPLTVTGTGLFVMVLSPSSP
jgi:hypothetical protein